MRPINLLLLVDDQEEAARTGRRIAAADLPVGRVLVAGTVDAALKVLGESTIDVVLLELAVAGGLPAVGTILAAHDGVLIVLTSLDDERVGIEAIRLGADDYLVKSKLTEGRLRSSVAYSLERHGRRHTERRLHENLDRLTAIASAGGVE